VWTAKNLSLLVLPALLAAPLALQGCANKCNSVDDCPPTQVCYTDTMTGDRSCRPGVNPSLMCKTDVDCNNMMPTNGAQTILICVAGRCQLNGTIGNGGGCSKNSDCAAPNVCDTGSMKCVPGCGVDAGNALMCSPGEVCDNASGQCMPAPRSEAGVDAGDTGVAPFDTGLPVPDSGVGPTDAAAPMDAAPDSGMSPFDGGTDPCATPTPTATTSFHAFATMGNLASDDLQSVWARCSSDVWATGGNTVRGPIVAHWDGMSWTEMALPGLAAGVQIFGVGFNDVWVTTGVQALHFVGGSWVDMSPPGMSLISSVWGSGPNDVYIAGGTAGMAGTVGAVYHTDGSTRAPVLVAGSSPLNGGAILSIFGSSTSTVYAGGAVGTSTLSMVHLTAAQQFGDLSAKIRGDGVRRLAGILSVWVAPSASNVWAVTSSSAVHFNGTNWENPAADPGVSRNIWGTGPNDVWVVTGLPSPIGAASGGTLRHFDGTSWSSCVPGMGTLPMVCGAGIPMTSGVRAVFGSVGAGNAADVWVVGDQGLILHNQYTAP
jgi:hypothetical protein